jgi:hypothetical protein
VCKETRQVSRNAFHETAFLGGSGVGEGEIALPGGGKLETGRISRRPFSSRSSSRRSRARVVTPHTADLLGLGKSVNFPVMNRAMADWEEGFGEPAWVCQWQCLSADLCFSTDRGGRLLRWEELASVKARSLLDSAPRSERLSQLSDPPDWRYWFSPVRTNRARRRMKGSCGWFSEID